jgi:hypothetical protein
MGLFRKYKDAYRVTEIENVSIKNGTVSPYYHYTVQRKAINLFGKEVWINETENCYYGRSIRTFKSKKEAEEYIKLRMYKPTNKVVLVYESREDKINGLLEDEGV